MKLAREFKLLSDYVDAHGHCNLSPDDKENGELFAFLSIIPRLYYEEMLSSSMITLLLRAGYDFKAMRSRVVNKKINNGLIVKDYIKKQRSHKKQFGDYYLSCDDKYEKMRGRICELYKTDSLTEIEIECLLEIEFFK
jgi:hypothetical protein